MKQNKVSFELCEDPENCEYCEYRFFSHCIFCGRDISLKFPAIHAYFDIWHGERKIIGDMCEVCRTYDLATLREAGKKEWDDKYEKYERDEKRQHELIRYAGELEDQANWLKRQANELKHILRNWSDWLEERRPLVDDAYDWDETKFNVPLARQTEAVPVAPPAPPKNAGYIYLIKSSDGFYKIGRTRNVPNRYNTLKIQLPMPVELIHSFFVDDCIESENRLHRHFVHKRHNGEWFKLSDDDVEWLCSLTTTVY